MFIHTNPVTYDAVIVGSGAGGGMAAKVLSESGLKVAVVEAGPFFDPANDKVYRHPTFYEMPEGSKNI